MLKLITMYKALYRKAVFDSKVSRNVKFESVQCWGNVSRWVIIKIWLNQWITWQSNFLDSDLSAECRDVKCPHVGHHSRVIVTDNDTWRISGPCHAVTSESRHSAGLWSRRGRSVLEEAPGISRAPLAPISRPGLGAGTDVHTVTPANRQSGGGSPAWSCNQAERERDWSWGRLSEESLSGLGTEKPGPYKEVLVRNGEKNGSIK